MNLDCLSYSVQSLKISQCSGQRPTCTKCNSRGIVCVYSTDLLDETHTQSIKRRYDELQATHSSCQEVYLYLQSASVDEAAEVLKRIRGGLNANTMLTQIREGRLSRLSANTKDKSARPPCFQQMLSWRLCHPNPKVKNAFASQLDQSTTLTLPPRPLDAYNFQSHRDTWTQTGWTKAHIQHLIDTVLVWDYLPISLLSYDHFLQSFYDGSITFCSSALVCALLALASRLVNEDKDEREILPTGWVGSMTFYKEAQAELEKPPTRNRLPDTQAIGVLSLYRLRCGEEAEALDYVESCFSQISGLRNKHSEDKRKDQCAMVQDATYCAALSLCRYVDINLNTGMKVLLTSHFSILRLTTGKVFHTLDPAPHTQPLILDGLLSIVANRDKTSSSGPCEYTNEQVI